MKTFYYILLAPGIQKKTIIAGKEYDVDWKSPYRSKIKKLLAPDEDVARYELRQKLKGRWTGFRLVRP
jgi:hypothetical protein